MEEEKMENVLDAFMEEGISYRADSIMKCVDKAFKTKCDITNVQLEIDFGRVRELVELIAAETRCHLRPKFCFFGVPAGEVLHTAGDDSDLYQYFVAVADEGNSSKTLWIHVPEKITERAQKFAEHAFDVLEDMNGEALARIYNDEILEVSKWAQAVAKWKSLKLWIVGDELDLCGDMPEERMKTSQSFMAGKIKAMLFEQNDELGDERKEGFLLRMYVPGFDPRAKLTKAIISQYGLEDSIARIISKSIADTAGRTKIEFTPAIYKYYDFLKILERSKIVSRNLAHPGGKVEKAPQKAVAAVLRNAEKSCQLLVYIPYSK